MNRKENRINAINFAAEQLGRWTPGLKKQLEDAEKEEDY